MASSSENMVLPVTSTASSEIQEVAPSPPPPPRRSSLHGGAGARKTKNKKKKMQKKKKGVWKNLLTEHHAWLQRQKDLLILVATLLAGMAFQMGLNPPGGVWGARYFDGANYYDAGTSVLATLNMSTYTKLYGSNTVAFVAALSVILILTSGLPFIGRGIFLLILTIAMWAAVTFSALTYAISVASFTPTDYHGRSDTVLGFVGYGVVSWGSLMLLLLFTHTVLILAGNRQEKLLVLGKEEEEEEEEEEDHGRRGSV